MIRTLLEATPGARLNRVLRDHLKGVEPRKHPYRQYGAQGQKSPERPYDSAGGKKTKRDPDEAE